MTKSWDHGGRSRQERGYGRTHEKMRKHLMATVTLCEACKAKGRTTIGTIADHKIPLAKGGSHARSNYQLLCQPCHAAKTLADAGRAGRTRRTIGEDGWPIEEKDNG